MAQHENCFAGSVLQGSCVLAQIAAGQLCIRSNLNHPHTLQRSWSTSLLAPAPPQRLPISHRCHTSPILFGNCAGNLMCHRSSKPPWPLLAPLFWNGKNSKLSGKVFQGLFWTQTGKFGQFCIFGGCGLPSSVAILRRPVPHIGFCLEKSIFWASKHSKKAGFGRKPYVNTSGFLRQFRGKFSKVKIHLPMVCIALLSVLKMHPRSCRPFSPLTATNLLVLAVW